MLATRAPADLSGTTDDAGTLAINLTGSSHPNLIVGNAGALVTRVEYVKKTGKKNFVIVDAAMNDLIRPAFYEAYHEILPVEKKTRPVMSSDVVGGVCESGDYFCKDRVLPKFTQGEHIALMSAGAYGFVMASNYNSRPRVPEVLIKGGEIHIIRERETYDDLIKGEEVPAALQ